MKKTIAILTALVLAVLCFPAAQAETGDVIRFQDIPWGSDVETVTQALLDAGWINEDGVKRMGDIEEHAERTRMGRYMGGSRIPQFVTEDGHIVADADDGSRNAVSGHLMSDMVAQELMGIEVHNIELRTACRSLRRFTGNRTTSMTKTVDPHTGKDRKDPSCTMTAVLSFIP